jgi:RNA polymerase sigma-70 factor (ECF subfamily)
MRFSGHEAEARRHMSSNDEDIRVHGSELAAPIAAARPPGGEASEPASSSDDDEIARAIATGDRRGALVLCARRHGAAIGRLCMAMVGTQAEAEDLVQDTLLAAHAGFGEYRSLGSVRAWLFGIARRKCARHLEQRANRAERLRLVEETQTAPEPEELVATRRLAERARAALSEVRPSEREALLMRYAGELSFREVGEACGIDEAAARKRVSRALARLRDALSREKSA